MLEGSEKMPRIDNESDIMMRVTGVENGPLPQMSNSPKYFVIRGVSPVGSQEVLISEDAARELLGRLTKLLPNEDDE
jgi:hypothetical protein